jgi:hypothetical protein
MLKGVLGVALLVGGVSAFLWFNRRVFAPVNVQLEPVFKPGEWTGSSHATENPRIFIGGQGVQTPDQVAYWERYKIEHPEGLARSL